MPVSSILFRTSYALLIVGGLASALCVRLIVATDPADGANIGAGLVMLFSEFVLGGGFLLGLIGLGYRRSEKKVFT